MIRVSISPLIPFLGDPLLQVSPVHFALGFDQIENHLLPPAEGILAHIPERVQCACLKPSAD